MDRIVKPVEEAGVTVPEEAQTQQTIANLRAERERPNLWIHLTEGECYALLAGTVPESVKLAVYESTEEAFRAKLIQNSEKPERRHGRQATAADKRPR